jgi:hypothetical protein
MTVINLGGAHAEQFLGGLSAVGAASIACEVIRNYVQHKSVSKDEYDLTSNLLMRRITKCLEACPNLWRCLLLPRDFISHSINIPPSAPSYLDVHWL